MCFQVLDVSPEHVVQRRPGPQRPGDAEGEPAGGPGVQCPAAHQQAADTNKSRERK